jgi:Tol biopolymer transport system component
MRGHVVAVFCAILVAGIAVPARAVDASTPGVVAFETSRDGDGEVYLVNADGSGQRNLTSFPAAHDFSPSISWDGNRVVFASDRDGTNDLWVVNVDGTGLRRLTSGDDQDSNPAWSPDGRTIAFLRITVEGDHEIFSVALSTRRVRNLTNSGGTLDAQPSFTTDGKILFMRDYDIWSMTATGQRPQRLTSDGATNEWPHMSPTGSRIVFHSTRAGSYDIWSMRPNGRDLRQLTDNPDNEAWPTWSPDGSTIIFGWRGDLATVGPDGGAIVPFPTADGCGGAGGDFPSWGPGRLAVDPPPPPPDPSTAAVAFTSDADGVTDVWVARADGSDPVNLTGGDCWTDASPQWSPDGTKIAFDSSRGGSFQIYVMDADGSDVTQLTTDDLGWENRRPSWSPDGTRIAFHGEGPQGYGTYVMDADGTDAEILLDDGSWPSSWAPSERILAHRVIAPNPPGFSHWSVWSLEPDGSDLDLLTPEDAPAYDGTWSPDASRIVLTLGRDIATMDADGTDLMNLDPDPSDDTYDDLWPSWTPGGEVLAFTSWRAGSYGLFLMDHDGGNVRTLIDTDANEAGPVWRPTG